MGSMNIQLLIVRVITLVIAFTVHEFSHAFTAVKLGDDTPRREGRLTLNPLKHLDIWGAIMLIAAGFGWAKPVRVNPNNFKGNQEAGMMLVSAAGPLSNFFLAALGAFLLLHGFYPTFANTSGMIPTSVYFLSSFMLINLNLMIFNLVPLSPLDGEKVLEYFIPSGARSIWNQIQHYGFAILMVLFFVLPYFGIDIFSKVLSPIVYWLYRLLTGV